MSLDEISDFARVYSSSAASKSSQPVGSKDSLENLHSHGVEGHVDLAGAMPQHFNEFNYSDDLYLDVVSPPFQSCQDEIMKIVGIQTKNAELMEPKESKKSHAFASESFEALRKYRSSRLKMDDKSSSTTHASAPSLSTEATIRFGAEKFIQSMSCCSNGLNLPSQCLSEDSKEVRLIQNLLSSAHKVARKQHEQALEFLKECGKMSSCAGTPIQRLVFYFSEVLFLKIATETGRTQPKDSEKKPVDHLESATLLNMDLMIAFHKKHPLAQMTKLVGVQAVLDHLQEARKVHVIDLDIKSGVQWTILMQDLVARSENSRIQRLKITAVGTKSKSLLENTGKHLESFAKSLNLEFSFRVVLVEDISDLNSNLFDLDHDESVAVYVSYALTNMIGNVDGLNHLMRVMQNMNPCVMVVAELEANCNSPSFIGRFVESLFLFGAFFDSMADCFEGDETSRKNAESSWFRPSITNILAAEGEERKIRHVSINVWRAFFARLGLVEIELSSSSLDQARLGMQSLPCGTSCTVYRDGKCLTLGWKGTPLCSLSAWKLP
ncbi:hypothetical protein C2S52_014400 [Perilla frutescens var. hirtella]|nr:hypothetical protein C2S52_014400 [Perilla frutescens var. hirtella]